MFPNTPSNVDVFCSTNLSISIVNNQQITTALLPPSRIVQNKFDEPSAYACNPRVHESVNLVHHQPLLDRIQQMPKHEQMSQVDKTSLTKDWGSEISISDKSHRERSPQLLSKFDSLFWQTSWSHQDRETWTWADVQRGTSCPHHPYRSGPIATRFPATKSTEDASRRNHRPG